MNAPVESAEAPVEPTAAPPRQRPFRTGLLIATSALLGGLAVVLWNRNSLLRLRQPPQSGQPAAPEDSETE